MADYGNTTVSYSQGFSTTVCWALDALAAAQTLTSITIRNGASLGSPRIRVALYKNTSTATPVGATLVTDFGQMTGGSTNSNQTISAGGEALASGDVVWLLMKFSGTSAEIGVGGSAGAGDFAANDTGSFTNGQITSDPTVAFPASISAFNGFDQGAITAAAYITIAAAGGGGGTLLMRRHGMTGGMGNLSGNMG